MTTQRGESTTTQEEEEEESAPPNREEEEKQHLPTEERWDHSPTRKRREGEQPNPKEGEVEAAPSKGREGRQHHTKGEENVSSPPPFGRWCVFSSLRSPPSLRGAAFLLLLLVVLPFSSPAFGWCCLASSFGWCGLHPSGWCWVSITPPLGRWCFLPLAFGLVLFFSREAPPPKGH